MISEQIFTTHEMQHIKAQEFELFFQRFRGKYSPHLNHLGEIHWMTDAEAADQHEYFDYEAGFWQRLKHKFAEKPSASMSGVSPEEKELRLQFRIYLEKKYLGEVQPETIRQFPADWQVELSDDEIEHIPISIETYEALSRWNKMVLLPVLMLTVLAIFGVAQAIHRAGEFHGSILIESNVRGAAIFLNGEKRGYADFQRLLSDVPPGDYRVELRKIGFASEPVNVNIGKQANASAKVFIPLNPLGVTDQGFIRIVADHPDSKVFVNDEFMGTLADQAVLPLEQGDHNIVIEKVGFRTAPQSRWVHITSGDTTKVKFEQTAQFGRNTPTTPARISSKPAEIGQGMLAITSNTVGGQIILNGEDTGKESDHVFTGMPYGEYRVRLERSGYQSVPEEKMVVISHNSPSMDISFELIKEFEQVNIMVEPATAQIIINGEPKAKGHFKGELKTGEYEISFGSLPGYNTPRPRLLRVTPNAPAELSVSYFPQIQAVAAVSGNGVLKVNGCDIVPGYTLGNRGFTASTDAGPEVTFVEKANDYFWKFGYAYQFRNPKGNDGLKITFNLPKDSQFNSRFMLKLFGASSEERYPMADSRKAEILIKLNGNVLSYYYQPKTLEELGGVEKTEWEISEHLRAGANTLEITVTDKNNAYYFLKKIELTNVE